MPSLRPIARTYWMVHNATKGGATNVTHETHREACEEAQRLAKKNPNHIFTVLRVVYAYQVEYPEPTELQVLPRPKEQGDYVY